MVGNREGTKTVETERLIARKFAKGGRTMNGMNVNVGVILWIESFLGEPVTFPFGIRNFYIADPEGNLLEIGSWVQD